MPLEPLHYTLGVVVMCGLLVALVVTLVVTPVLLVAPRGITQLRAASFWQGSGPFFAYRRDYPAAYAQAAHSYTNSVRKQATPYGALRRIKH